MQIFSLISKFHILYFKYYILYNIEKKIINKNLNLFVKHQVIYEIPILTNVIKQY